MKHDLVLCSCTKCPFNKRNVNLSLMYNICTLPAVSKKLVIDQNGRCEAYLVELNGKKRTSKYEV